MSNILNSEQIKLIKECGRILSDSLEKVKKAVKKYLGISIDEMSDNGIIETALKGYRRYLGENVE